MAKTSKNCPSSKRLLYITGLMAVFKQPALAYTNGNPTTAVFGVRMRSQKTTLIPAVVPTTQATSPPPQEQQQQTETTGKSTNTRSSPVSYDLGLGKNAPVGFHSPTPTTTTTDDVYRAAQFLLEHEAAVPYPAPLQKKNQTQQQPKCPLPPVPLQRFSDDVLKIVQDDQKAAPTAFASDNEWDLNTPWVEMLIHEQQAKLAFKHN